MSNAYAPRITVVDEEEMDVPADDQETVCATIGILSTTDVTERVLLCATFDLGVGADTSSTHLRLRRGTTVDGDVVGQMVIGVDPAPDAAFPYIVRGSDFLGDGVQQQSYVLTIQCADASAGSSGGNLVFDAIVY